MARILLVDDEDVFRTSIKMILEKQKHDILETNSGLEAIKLIKKGEKFDLLIMDVVMPGKGGIETLIELQGISKEMKIILITGKVLPEIDALKRLGTSYGAYKILYKPFKKDELLDTLKELKL